MRKRGKKYQDSIKAYDQNKLHTAKEAVVELKKLAKANFDETVELHVNLGVDGRHADQLVRGTVVLPHGTGKKKTVLVIAKGEKAEEAKAAGADFVGADDMIEKIQSENWLDFDVLVATPDMMGMVGRLGRTLGPKGLMPSPKAGTVTFEVENAVKEIKAGKVEYRIDKANIVHVIVGKISFDDEKIEENINVMLDTLVKARPSAVPKHKYIQSITTTSTMGPGIKMNPLDYLS